MCGPSGLHAAKVWKQLSVLTAIDHAFKYTWPAMNNDMPVGAGYMYHVQEDTVTQLYIIFIL